MSFHLSRLDFRFKQPSFWVPSMGILIYQGAEDDVSRTYDDE